MRGFRLPPVRRRLWLLVGTATAIALGGGATATYLAAQPQWPAAMTAAAVALLLLVWVSLDWLLFRPLAAVDRGARIMARSNPAHALELGRHHWLGELPDSVQALGDALARSRAELDKAVASWSAQIEDRKNRLETVVREIREGVVVCDGEGRILLYNEAARALLRDQPALGLGRSVMDVLAHLPLEHTLEMLRHGSANGGSEGHRGADFVCATADASRLLRCRLGLLPDGTAENGGFVLTLEDVSAATRDLLRQERALRRAIEDLRDPLASLSAAADNLEAAEEKGLADARQRFERIIRDESRRLASGFDTLFHEAQNVVTDPWRLADLYSEDILASVQRTDAALPEVRLITAGHWLRAEGYLIGQVLRELLLRLGEEQGVETVEVETTTHKDRVYVDLVWAGEAVPSARLAGWLDAPLEDAGSTVTTREVLDRHDTAIWSRAHPERPGHALLRLPLPASQHEPETRNPLPPRPEFYDFSLGERARPLGELAERPLAELDYVVFDTETTGLEPSHGDEIIQIGAVRVSGTQVRDGETFETLINPGREIPETSTRFHGITDEDVADAPDITVALPRFREFVGDAVLVAHNAAFDMRFLRLKQRNTGVRFDNPVLDTLLLSILIHDHTPDHALESIARRLGVEVSGRHTAMGDALTTAEIFTALVHLLPDHGIVTLRDAVNASERMVEFRRQQRAF
ncbi:exonuclease domain-containing protein [Arhodomonas sp. SL1]|uniref:3'-5' exonuclease n=1 Tax=Arhodomonas sp. SL1 TaxID=3425691 RepID=UPI003F885D82